MTKDKNFKALVREHMRETGQNYTSARAELRDDAPGRQSSKPHPTPTHPSSLSLSKGPSGSSQTPPDDAWQRAEADQRTTIARFITDGRLVHFPAKRKARAAVLLHLVQLFEAHQVYDEIEVNRRLLTIVDDQAFWRRELVNYGYLHRSAGRYWLTTQLPVRTANLAQEIPAWEALWLPVHLGLATAPHPD